MHENLTPAHTYRANRDSLLPAHFTDTHPDFAHLQDIQDPQERWAERERLISDAPPLDEVIREHVLPEMGIEPKENTNYGWEAVQGFRVLAREAESVRRSLEAFRDFNARQVLTEVEEYYNDPSNQAHNPRWRQELEQARADVFRAQMEYQTNVDRLALLRKQISEYLDPQLAPSFEKDYREYITVRRKLFTMYRLQHREVDIVNLLSKPTLAGPPRFDGSESYQSEIPYNVRSRAERVANQQLTQGVEYAEQLAALKTIYGEDTPEYRIAVDNLNFGYEIRESVEDILPQKTKEELRAELEEIREQIMDIWGDQYVRLLAVQRQRMEYVEQVHEGKRVIETESVIRSLNMLHRWELEEDATTIGGALVGPPGVGKTTVIRHYLEEKGRRYTYIDLSGEVTRYMLFGVKDVEFRPARDQYRSLAQDLGSLDEASFRQFIEKNREVVENAFQIKGNEATVQTIQMVIDALGNYDDIPEDLRGEMLEIQTKLVGMAETTYQKELAHSLQTLVKRNGFRDGVVIESLRQNLSLILDEFPRFNNWSSLFSLMESKPGDKWFFADNREWIDIPKDWHMYFTANIGRKHGGFETVKAMASRLQGKVMEVDYPDFKEEIFIGIAMMCDPEGNWLRSEADLAKLFTLVRFVFKEIRTFIADERQSIDISYRTLRRLASKLVRLRDEEGNPLNQPTTLSFDQALLEVFIESYAVYEDKEKPKNILNRCLDAGLLLDPAIKDKVVAWVDEDRYNEALEAAQSGDKNPEQRFQDIIDELSGRKQELFVAPQPVKNH